MGGLALIARELGHQVSGSDANVYPPMSLQLETQGIRLHEGYDTKWLSPRPDMVIIGNAMSRGNPMVEYILNEQIPFMSGPEWLANFVIRDRWVLGAAGTHGKTTTAGMLTWILESAKLNPSYLIGGVPGNFEVSARLVDSPYFVIEADEYDTAFFDKRSKFIHYHPRTLILNNLEYDHADIFDDIDDIKRQFHHLVRIVPEQGRIVANADDHHLNEVLEQGCWTPVVRFGGETGHPASRDQWRYRAIEQDYSRFEVSAPDNQAAIVEWGLIGKHNAANATAAIIAAHHVGVPMVMAAEALANFRNAKRRLELIGTQNDVKVYDDFAHHPTAIRETIGALRSRVGVEPIIVALELRSNTMRLGSNSQDLAKSLLLADEVFILKPEGLNWDLYASLRPLGRNAHVLDSVPRMVEGITKLCKPGSHLLVMSNGSFDNIHQKLLDELANAA